MNILKKTSCLNCTKEFHKSKMESTQLCKGCFQFAIFLYSVFIFEYKKILNMIENPSNFDEAKSRYNSLSDFVQRELKPWYYYSCLPQITRENIKTLQNVINQKLIIHKNSLLDDLIIKPKDSRKNYKIPDFAKHKKVFERKMFYRQF